jgi:hypothetical protein
VWGDRRPYYAFVKIQDVLYAFSQKIRLQSRFFSPTECLRLHPASKKGITAAAVTRLLNDTSFRCGTLKMACLESFRSSL